MSLDFAAVLTKMVEVRASDVHLTPGFAPAVRVRGRIVPMDDYPPLSPPETREVVYSILNDSQRKKFENQQPKARRARLTGLLSSPHGPPATDRWRR
jgi:twitching motility protein PilT